MVNPALSFAGRAFASYYYPHVLRSLGYRRAASAVRRSRYAKGALAFTGAAMMAPFVGGRKRGRDGNVKGRIQDASGYVQLTKLRPVKVGRSIGNQKYLNKLMSSMVQTRIDRFQSLSASNSVSGKYGLSYAPDAAVPTIYSLPLYTFDLTSLSENIWDPGSAANNYCKSQPFQKLYRDAADPYPYKFIPVNGVKADGSTQSLFWQSERQPYNAGAGNDPYEKCLLEWVDIRLAFWGATSVPSSVEVLICRFPNDIRCPSSTETLGTLADTTGGTVTGTYPAPTTPAAADSSGISDYIEYQKFWQSQTDNLIGSTQCVRLQAADQNGMVVLYRKKIDFNPTATYETDTTGHQFSMKLFYEMNMLCDYKHSNVKGDKGTTSLVPPDGVAEPNKWVAETGAASCHSVLRNKTSRVFLVIKGTTPVQTAYNAAAATVQANNPSFDLMIRRKVSVV